MPSGIRFPDLARWLAWQQSLHPKLIDLGLERVARVLSGTGWRKPTCPIITVWVLPSRRELMKSPAAGMKVSRVPATTPGSESGQVT